MSDSRAGAPNTRPAVYERVIGRIEEQIEAAERLAQTTNGEGFTYAIGRSHAFRFAREILIQEFALSGDPERMERHMPAVSSTEPADERVEWERDVAREMYARASDRMTIEILEREEAEEQARRYREALEQARSDFQWFADYSGPDGRAEAFAAKGRVSAVLEDTPS